MAHSQNLTVLPMDPVEITLGPWQSSDSPSPLFLEAYGCRIRTGNKGILRWRGIALWPEDQATNTVQITAAEFGPNCWLFFAREFDRRQTSRPEMVLVGPASVRGRVLTIRYEDFGATPTSQLYNLLAHMASNNPAVSQRLARLPIGFAKSVQ
ncbi:MAG: hypothetical protein AB7F86_08860 [Bdellovibrionales bacterium]